MNTTDQSLETAQTAQTTQATQPLDAEIHVFYTNKAFFWRNAAILLLMVFYCAIALIFKINALFSSLLACTALLLASAYSIFNLMGCRGPYVICGKDFIQVGSRRAHLNEITFLDNQTKAHFVIHYKPQNQQTMRKAQDDKLYIFWRRMSAQGQSELRLLLEKLMHERANRSE